MPPYPANDLWYAHVTVATVVEKDGLYLLVEEYQNGSKVLNQPAGHLEPGENLEQAAIRETLEETAWRVELSGFMGLSQYLAPNGTTYVRSTFVGHTLEYQSEITLDSDIIDVHWLSYDEILQQTERLRSPMVLADINKYRAGDHYPLSVFQEYK